MYKKFGRRPIGIVLSTCGFFTPLRLILTVAIKIDDPGSVFLSRSELPWIKWREAVR